MKTQGLKQYSIGELATCAKRELTYRHRVYRRLVLEGKMSETRAQAEIGMMKAIVDNLQAQDQLPLL